MPAPVDDLADWSPWRPFAEAAHVAPRRPGVYLVRQGSGPIVYVGCAGERAGGGRPKGLQGRLAVYASGKALTSGLGEAVADRALADPSFIEARLAEVSDGRPLRAKEWGRATVAWAELEVCWAETDDKAAALALEDACGARLTGLWNRRRLGSPSG